MSEAPGPAGPPADFRLRDVAVTAYGPSVLESLGYGAAIPIVPLLARHLGASIGTAAFIAGLLGIGQLVTSLPAGSLIARVGEQRALIVASVGGALTAAMAGLAPNLVVLGAATFATGMVWSVFLLARQGFMIDAVPVHMRARSLSTLGGMHRVGLVIGPLLGAAAISLAGLRAAYAVSVVASLLALTLVLRVPDLGEEARENSRAEPASLWQVLGEHRHTLLTLGSSAMLISALRAVRMGLLPLWADHVGLSGSQTSLLFAIGGAVEVAVFYPAGWVMDRAGRVVVAVPCVVLMAIGMLLLPLTGSFVTVLLVTALMAFGNGLGSGIVMTLGADTAPILHRAKYLGGWRVCGDIGATGGPLIVSGLATVSTLATTSRGIGAGAVLGSAWVARWVWLLDRRRQR